MKKARFYGSFIIKVRRMKAFFLYMLHHNQTLPTHTKRSPIFCDYLSYMVALISARHSTHWYPKLLILSSMTA